MKTRNAKAKGRRLQNWVRDLILDLWCDSLEPKDVRSNPMGVTGEDISFSPKAEKLLGLVIECKARESIAVYRWYEQGASHADDGRLPVLVIKENRKKPLAVVDAEELFKLIRRVKTC